MLPAFLRLLPPAFAPRLLPFRIPHSALRILLLISFLLPAIARAGDIPPRPSQYFNDEAHIVDDATARQFNTQLEDFERQTSNQFVVAIYPKLNTDDSVDDYCYRAFQAWQVGQKKLNNGVVLFVFVQDHKIWIQTGYGLEGALPDVICARIIRDEIAPRFKQGDYAGGLRAGINAIIAASKNEYKGNGTTVAGAHSEEANDTFGTVFAILFLCLWLFLFFRRARGIIYGSSGIGAYGGFFLGGGGGGFSGSGGGGFSDSGGFSGGGGSSGGGGAGGSW